MGRFPDRILARSIRPGDKVHAAGKKLVEVSSTRRRGRCVYLKLVGGGELVCYTSDLVRVTLKEADDGH